MRKYENVPTGDLRVGDRINDYGMILRIDQEIHQSKAHPVDEDRGPVVWTKALIENWDEVNREADAGHSIFGFIRGRVRSDLRYGDLTEPRWSIQGNNWATWSRIVDEA